MSQRDAAMSGSGLGWYIRVIAKIWVLDEEVMTKDLISHAMARFLVTVFGGGGTREQQRRGQQRESYRERQFVFVPHPLAAYTAQPPSIVKAPAVRPSGAAPHGRRSGRAGSHPPCPRHQGTSAGRREAFGLASQPSA